MKLIVLAVLSLLSVAHAARVTGTIYDNRGLKASGSLILEWSGFTTAGGKVVAPGRRTTYVVNGAVDATLEETVGATPAGTAYRVTYRVFGYAGANVENWEVPAGSSALADVRRSYVALPVSGVAVSFSDAEVPGGLVNSSNVTFTLSASPSPAASLILVRNGVTMKRGEDYLLSGATVTFQPSAIPQTDDLLQAWYRY